MRKQERRPRARRVRVRRTAEAAREAIVDAAEQQLVAAGPAALRLQQVAAEVGVSHSTVLHHFGSREALLKAVVERALNRLQADLVDAIGRAPIADLESDSRYAEKLLERVAAAFGQGGHGRAIAWLALSGLTHPDGDLRLRQIAEVVHAGRRHRRGERTPPYEDTLFSVLLTFLALLAQSMVGPHLWGSAGLADDARAGERFRKWLAKLVMDHLRDA